MSKTIFLVSVFVVTVFSVCFLGVRSEIARAEEVEQEQDQEEEDVTFLSMLEDIKDGVTDIKDILEDSRKQDEEFYQVSVNEQKELNDNIGGVDNGTRDSNDLYDSDNNVSELSTEDAEQVGPEEGTTEMQEGEKNDNNAEDDPVQLENVTRQDILDLRSDLQKIMISMWALAGLLLGTKLISRMFGNG